MYYIKDFNTRDGFNSAGKLFNELAYMADLGQLSAIQVQDGYDSLGNLIKIRVPGIKLNRNKLHNDLEIIKDPCGSSGKVVCHRYLQYDNFYNIVDVICDPPIELCKINIH